MRSRKFRIDNCEFRINAFELAFMTRSRESIRVITALVREESLLSTPRDCQTMTRKFMAKKAPEWQWLSKAERKSLFRHGPFSVPNYGRFGAATN